MVPACTTFPLDKGNDDGIEAKERFRFWFWLQIRHPGRHARTARRGRPSKPQERRQELGLETVRFGRQQIGRQQQIERQALAPPAGWAGDRCSQACGPHGGRRSGAARSKAPAWVTVQAPFSGRSQAGAPWPPAIRRWPDAVPSTRSRRAAPARQSNHQMFRRRWPLGGEKSATSSIMPAVLASRAVRCRSEY